MKTVLTLKYSSFLFFNKLSLVKNTPKEINTEELSQKDIEVLNGYISSGSIHSSEGLVPVELKEDEKIESPNQEKEEVKQDEEVVHVRNTLNVLDAPVVEKKAAPKRTPVKKVTK